MNGFSTTRGFKNKMFLLCLALAMLTACDKEQGLVTSSVLSSNYRLNEAEIPNTFDYNTYNHFSLDIICETGTLFKVYGQYNGSQDILGTYYATHTSFQKNMEISGHYNRLHIEAYHNGEKDVFESNIDVQTNSVQFDFTKTFKTTSSIPTNVLYAVNSQADFIVVNTTDYAYDSLPQLLAGTIACAVDTFNNRMYYHSNRTMYQYDIASQVHSVAYTNANPFGSGNFPRMEFDYVTRNLFLSNSSNSIKEVNPANGNVVASYTIQGLVNNSGGGDLAFLPNGDRFLACFSGLYRLNFAAGSSIVQATRISAENMPYQLTSAGYDRQGFVYACTNDTNSKMLKLDPNDGSYVIVRTFPMRINDLGSVVSFSNSICTIDSDNDGVCDELDDFPTDSTACCAQYTPSQLGAGTVAFEDQWPCMGDFDFNDLVVSYNYIEMKNTNDELVKIKARFQVKAVGASYNNGFGFQLDLDPNNIASVTGAVLQKGIVSTDAKGLEIGQSKPTVIVFEDATDVIDYVGGPYINTDPNQPVSTGQIIDIEITLTQPLTVSKRPENPFIFVNGNRSHEIHLPDHAPTSLANTVHFGTLTDDSNPGNGRYYKNKHNVPWAIDIAHNFRYPREKNRVDEGYNFMVHWAMSNGNTYVDWYKDNSGYRNVNKLYMKH